MAFSSPADGASVNSEALKRLMAGAPAESEDEGGDDEGQTVGEKFAGNSDRLGEASLPDSGGPGAKYVGPAAGPMQSKPQLTSALSMMGGGSPSPSLGASADVGASKSSIPMLTQQQLQSALDQKKNIIQKNALFDALSNQQSFGNFFLGHLNPRTDSSALTRQQTGLVDQGIGNTQTLQQQAARAPEMQYAADLGDPSSKASQERQQQLKLGIQALAQSKMIDPDQAQSMLANADKMSGMEAEKMMGSNPLLKQAADMMKSQAMIAMSGRKLDQGDQRIAMAKDNQTNSAVASLDKDPLLQSTQRQLNQIGIDRHTLTSAKIITPQMVHEIGQGIAQALSGGKAVGLGMAEMQDMGTSQTKLAALEQMLTNAPQNGASPEIKQQIVETLDRLEDGYRKVQGARAKQLAVGRSFPSNPGAAGALQKKVDSYQAPGGQGVPGLGDVLAGDSPSKGFSDDDKQLLQWVQKNPNAPGAREALMELNKKAARLRGN